MIIDIPTVEGGVFIDGGANTLGTIVRANFLNSLMKSSTATTKEIQTILTKNSIQPDDRVHDQLFKAISKMVTDGKVALTDVLGTSKTLAASQFLVNEVNKLALLGKEKADLFGIQANNNAKEIEKKMSIGDFGVGGSNISTEEQLNAFDLGLIFKGDPSSARSPFKRAGALLHLGAFTNAIYQMHFGIDGKVEYRKAKEGAAEWGAIYEFLTTSNTFKDKNGFFRDKDNKLDALTTADLDSLIQVPVDQIFYFDSATPPTGYIARNGQAIDKVKMPKLFARYGANMPDDRDLSYRNAGTLAGAVGTRQEDAVQNATGSTADIYGGPTPSSEGALQYKGEITNQISIGTSTNNRSIWGLRFDLSKSYGMRTGNETRVKSRIILACNKIQ